MRLYISLWPVPSGALGNLIVRIADSNGNGYRKFRFDTVLCSLADVTLFYVTENYVQRGAKDCVEVVLRRGADGLHV